MESHRLLNTTHSTTYDFITNTIVSSLAAGRPIYVWPDIFPQICVCIYNIVRGKFKLIPRSLNLNITTINDIMINSPNDRQNHRTGFGRRNPNFEVSF